MNFLKKLAPFLSTGLSLLGLYGAIANKLLAPILGLKPDAAGDQYAEALAKATPEQIEAIKKAEQDFQLQMKQLDIQSVDDLEKIAADDRASARNREIQVTAATGKKDWTPRFLAMGIVIAFVTAVFMVLSGHAKAESVIAGTLIGYLSAKAELVLAYFFGSSAGSDRKTELLAGKQ